MEEIRLSDILLIIWRRKGVLIATVALFLIAALLWGFFLVERDFRVDVPLRLDQFEYNVEPHRRGYMQQFFREAGREITALDDRVVVSVIQETLADEDHLPSSQVEINGHELVITFMTDNPGDIEGEIPRLVEILNNALTRHYSDFVNRMQERLLVMVELEIATLAGQIEQIDAEIDRLAEEEGLFIAQSPGEPVLHPLYQELSSRKGDILTMKTQLQEEQKDLAQLPAEKYFAASTVEEAGEPRVVNLTPQRRIVTGIAGILGLFVGLFLVYLLSIGDLKGMVARREEHRS